MKLTKAELQDGGKEDKREFSRFKTMGESIKKSAVVTALLLSTAFGVGCGGGPTGDPPNDAGMGGGDGGSSSGLCAMYPHGSANRAELRGGDIIKPASNTDGYLMYFKQSDGTNATIAIYPTANPSAEMPYSFQVNETRAINIPGATGTVNMQGCNLIGGGCTSPPGGPISGDTSCIFVIAADRPFAPAH
jgi:hypothetical protein